MTDPGIGWILDFTLLTGKSRTFPGIVPFGKHSDMKKIRILIWNEHRDDRENPAAAAVYPEGIHYAIGNALAADEDLEVFVGTLDSADQGLPTDILESTQVLVWWAHHAHRELDNFRVEHVIKRVKQGMGLLALHSAHFAEPFIRLLGTSCRLGAWNENGGAEKMWALKPKHPISSGLPSPIILPKTEMYCEPFEVPEPDELLYISSFSGGEVFRSGCLWRRGKGRIFYLRPGHETYPIYHNPEIQKLLRNIVRWMGGLPV